MERGKFVVLEGIDNCGKTTQSALLKTALEEKGLKVLNTREPGGTEVGEEIRGVLLKPREKMMDPISQTLLFYGSRLEFINNVLKPNLNTGVNVISDRFEASTYVYQGIKQGVDKGFIDTLSRGVVGHSNCYPNIYIILDIPAEESFRRGANEDRKGQDLIYERQGIEFMEELRQGYLKFAKEFKGCEVVLLDGTKNKEEIHAEILALVEEKLIKYSQQSVTARS